MTEDIVLIFFGGLILALIFLTIFLLLKESDSERKVLDWQRKNMEEKFQQLREEFHEELRKMKNLLNNGF